MEAQNRKIGIEYVSIEQIKPFERNPKKHPERQIEKVKNSIERFGFVQPVVISSDGELIIGHCRLLAAKQLGLLDVPAIFVDDLTGPEITALRIADNRLNESKWIMEEVISQGQLLPEDLQRLTGFDPKIFLSADEKDDNIPSTPAVPKSKLGDVYELGNHRLIVGDSTDPELVKKLMGGGQADMVFTDPPYNVNYKGQSENTKDGIQNDNMSVDAFTEFLRAVFKNYRSLVKDGAALYVFHSSSTQAQFEEAINGSSLHIKTQLIWNKPSAALGWGDYRWKHEPFFYCGVEKFATQFYGDRTNSTIWEQCETEEDLAEWAEREKRAEKAGRTTVWTMKRDNVNGYVHPCLPAGELIFSDGHWKPIENVIIGEKTSYGIVKNTSNHEALSIVEIETEDGLIVRSTGNHPFLVERAGDIFWVEARLIQNGDFTLTNTNVPNTLKPCQEEKTDYQPLDQSPLRDIAESTTKPNGDKDLSTSSCGREQSDPSQKECKSTTKMETSSTIVLRTSKLSVPLSISGITLVASRTDLDAGISHADPAGNSSQSMRNTGILAKDGQQGDGAGNVASNEASVSVRLYRRKVGSVRIIQKTERVYNLNIKGIPAFDTIIGVSHNTQKPVELIERAIHNSSKAGDLIVDLFLGSGSTMIAAEKTRRKCYGMELDPKYADVIVKRWCEFTEESTVILNGESIVF